MAVMPVSPYARSTVLRLAQVLPTVQLSPSWPKSLAAVAPDPGGANGFQGQRVVPAARDGRDAREEAAAGGVLDLRREQAAAARRAVAKLRKVVGAPGPDAAARVKRDAVRIARGHGD